jgi:hypothetical protein
MFVRLCQQNLMACQECCTQNQRSKLKITLKLFLLLTDSSVNLEPLEFCLHPYTIPFRFS